MAVSATAQGGPELFEAVEGISAPAVTSAGTGPWVLRQQLVRLNAEALDLDGASASEDVVLNLFPDVRYAFKRTGAAEVLPGGNLLWRAVSGNGDSGYAVLVIGEHGVRGNIADGAGRHFKIVPAYGQVQELREVSAGFVDMTDDGEAPPIAPGALAEESPHLALQVMAAQGASSNVDVLVLYSPKARQFVGGQANVQALADLVFAEMNQALVASEVNAQVALAGLVEVAFPNGEASNSSFLGEVRNTAALQQLRDQYGADLVSVWIDGSGSAGGIGYVMNAGAVGPGFAPYAYSVAEIEWVDGPVFAFAHEVGHNLGSGHDRNTGCDGGAFGYSCGFQQLAQAPHFHTIMAYQSGCSQCPKINQFSNPNVTHQGMPTGVATGPDSADNGRTFNQTTLIASQFRDEVASGVPCDLSGEGAVNVVDVQLGINQALGLATCGTADISQDGSCNVIDVQRLINAAIGLGCQVGS